MSYTNWAPGQPDNKTDEDCLVADNGVWHDSSCETNHTLICERQIVATVKSDTQFIFTGQNISKSAIQLTWKSQYKDNNTKSFGGFKLRWAVRQNNESLELNQIKRKLTARAIEVTPGNLKRAKNQTQKIGFW